MQIRQEVSLFTPTALSEEQAQQFYFHLRYLGLRPHGAGIRLLQFICSRLSTPETFAPIPDSQITIRSLADLAKVLKYCDIIEQDICLAAIETLLPNENPNENLIFFELLPRHRKMAIIEANLASEDNVATLLRNNDTTNQLIMHAVDFSVHTPHALLNQLQTALTKFNIKLIKDIEKNKNGAYKIDEQTAMHKSCNEALIELIGFIRSCKDLLPPLIIEILSCINNVLLNNFGVTDSQKRYRRMVGFYITRFWSALINKNCCHFLAQLAESQFNGKYMAEDFCNQITAAYNTSFVNIIQKITTSSHIDSTINGKYRDDQLEIIKSPRFRDSLHSHITVLGLNRYNTRGTTPTKIKPLVDEAFTVQLQAIDLRLKMNLLVRIAQSSIQDHGSFFSPRRKATTSYRMQLFGGELTFIPSLKELDNIKFILESAFSKHNDTSSEDYQKIDWAIAACVSLKQELLAFLPEQSKESYFSSKSPSPREFFTNNFFQRRSMPHLSPRSPRKRSQSEGNVFEYHHNHKDTSKKSPH